MAVYLKRVDKRTEFSVCIPISSYVDLSCSWTFF